MRPFSRESFNLGNIFFVLSAIISVSLANVIGIDFGSDSMKVAIVQPGTPLEIVTNFQSKRKTPTAVTFYRGERMFGSDSTALLARKPELTFTQLTRTIGRSFDHPIVEAFQKQYFPYEFYRNESLGKTSLKQEETYYTPEDLLAMMMQYAKEMTANYGGKVIKDCVLTVPSSFTQHERAALFAAADIAELRVLSLIEENTAAALHYGIDRVFEQPHTVLYYNMGANSLQVSIVTYSSYVVKEAGKNKTIGQFEVVGKAWDATLGGFAFDLKLAELLADRFDAVWSKKPSGVDKTLRSFMRPMTRLRIEANKLKEVLSANNELPVKIEQLHADVDLHTKVTRSELEEACAELFASITKPIEKALEMANLTLDQVNAVELLGGGVRMPKVKKLLEDYFKPSKLELGQHLNGDEAMALGAAFRAANLSTAFRVRKVGMTDMSAFGVSVNLETLPKGEGEGGFFSSIFSKFTGGEKEKKPASTEEAVSEEWRKHIALYPAKSYLPSKSKTLAFNYDKDILCKVEYDDGSLILPEGTNKLLAVYNITGVADFAKETSSKGLGAPKVHLSFALDASGIVSLTKAEATLELPNEPEAAAASEEEEEKADAASEDKKADEEKAEGESDKAAGGEAEGEEEKEKEKDPEEKKEGESADGEKAADKDDEKKADSKDSKKSSKKSSKKQEKKEKKKDNILRKVLSIEENPSLLTPAGWTPSLVAESIAKLRALTLIDEQRKAKEAALNDLEAYIYKVKNRISDDEKELAKVSTDEQRQTVLDLCSETEEWLYEDGRNADVTGFKAKHTDIRVKAEAIFKRFTELTARPAAVEKARSSLKELKTKVGNWHETMPHVTDEEKGKLLDAVEKAVKWLDEKEELQATKTAFEDAVFYSADVMPQLKTVTLLFEKLLKKPKPAPPKPTVAANETAAGNGTTEGEPIKVNVKTESETEGAEGSSDPKPEEKEEVKEDTNAEGEKAEVKTDDSEL